MNKPYPQKAPFDKGHINVGDGHQLYYERFGNPYCQPVVYLHGGPGAGCAFNEYRLFHPDYFQVILFNQRGSGSGERQSLPNASDSLDALRDNNFSTLVADLETLRTAFKIEKWDVCGGSFGSTLAMHYALHHPESINRLLLRGIFFGDQIGAHHITEPHGAAAQRRNGYFDAYENFIPQTERSEKSLMQAFSERVLSPENLETAKRAAHLFDLWDTSIALKDINSSLMAGLENAPDDSLGMMRIWYHFCAENFCDADRPKLLRALSDFPRSIDVIHGRQDHICPVSNAIELQGACPWANVQIIEDCGHSMLEEKLQSAFINITRKWARENSIKMFNLSPYQGMSL